MRKIFPLELAGRHRDRVVEALKHEIRKYIQRERRRALPEGADYWDFDCRFGATRELAEAVHPATLTALIDAAARDGCAQVYVEILARPEKRKPRPPQPAADASAASDAPKDG